MIYLDYNATSPLHPKVKEAMIEAMGEAQNPSSIHAAGRAARKLKEDARKKILDFVGAEALVFCGSGTEANNLALAQSEKHMISSVEHDSIFKTARNPEIVNVDINGLVKLDKLEEKISEGCLVSIILANNETGVIQNIKPIAELCKKHNAILHIDAVQAFGKIGLNMQELGADLMTICAHKIGGPVGVAALCHRADLELKPILFGGGQEKNKRPGTENLTAIIGFAKSCELEQVTPELRDYLENRISKIAPDIVIHGKNSPRIANTTSISMPNMEAATQLIHFDSKNICVSAGSACSSGKMEESRVLHEMNVPMLKNAIRISLGWKTEKDDIDKFLNEWESLYKRANQSAA